MEIFGDTLCSGKWCSSTHSYAANTCIEQKDMSIDDYYNSYDRLMASLLSMVPQCTAGDGCSAHSFIERFLTYRFVMRVRDEFDSLCTRLLHSASDLTMAKALSELLAEETRLRSLSSS